MGFDSVELSDVLTEKGYIRGPFGSALKRGEMKDSGIPVYEQNHAIYGEREFRYFIDQEKFEDLNRFQVQEDDLIISCSGTVGEISIIDKSDPKGIISQALLILRVDTERMLPHFLRYFFTSRTGRYLLLGASHGSVQNNIAKKSIVTSIPIPLPSLEIQNEIVDQLYTIDQKIHLNEQTNETLEKIAQAIFKSWFVDFDPVRAKIEAASADRDPNRAAMAAIVGVTIEQDWDAIEAALQQKLDRMSDEQRTQLRQIAELFPDELVESEIGMVPKGWEYSTIGKEFDIVNGQSPPGSSYNEEGEGSPFYQGRTDFGFRFPTQRVYCTEPKRFAKKGDTLLSVRAPVGDLNIAIEDCCIGRGIASLRHKSGSVSYTYYAMKQVQAQIEAYEATGTVFGSINQKQLKALDTIAPDRKVINEFHRIADPIDSKVMNQAFMNRELSKLRDTLLPKLISGEVGV